jgi:hypothetical protein
VTGVPPLKGIKKQKGVNWSFSARAKKVASTTKALAGKDMPPDG